MTLRDCFTNCEVDLGCMWKIINLSWMNEVEHYNDDLNLI